MSAKFKDFKYKRPDIKSFGERFDALLSEFENASDAGMQFDILKNINAVRKDFYSMSKIASIRYTINTEDKFYDQEHDYFNDIGPVFSGYIEKLYKALVRSKYREELEKLTGKEIFNIADLFNKTFSPEIIEDLKKENRLVTRYVKLVASAAILFEGNTLNLAGIEKYMQSENREVRKNAFKARWKFFEDKENEFDNIYDELVRLRTNIAKKLGYKNFVELGYDRLGRTDYTSKEVAAFRESVKKYIVPVALESEEMRKQRLGLDRLYYFDSSLNFKNGTPDPKGSPEWIVERAKKMYAELSPETDQFFKLMTERDLMDLYNRKGKAAGGYCSFIANYESPFIFANMNGTSHDVKVLTHEAGHAFQVYESRNFEVMEYINPTLEACEIHSMSMEFITWPWMQLFFEEDTDKFFFSHLSRSVNFIPYGSAVDEFQHYVYENHEATPAERKLKWRETEKKYLPQIDYEENNFLERGGFWYTQGHIFKRPFYYIDYCLAEICALQFWKKCNNDRDIAWEEYLKLCKAGGSKSFLELLKIANLNSPFESNTVKYIIEYCNNWLQSMNKDF